MSGRPPLPVRAVIKLFRKLGYDYVQLPFSAPRTCNLCGYTGKFRYSGLYYIRPDALCMSCWSTDRERLLAHYVQAGHWSADGKAVLHFAPEPKIVDLLRARATRYVTADLFVQGVDVAWNVEDIDCGDQEFDAIICSHVLEHVDTPKALSEMYRVLKPGGRALLMIPIYEGLDTTYTDPDVPESRNWLHFHQHDHVRLIGRDFRDQIRSAGLELVEFNAPPEVVIKHGMVMGEKIFVASRPE
ncbi:MAG: methyltransferase domain-containing protein [Pseudomonadota bacterium]